MKNAAVGGNRSAEPAELGRCAASGTLYHPFGLEPRYHGRSTHIDVDAPLITPEHQ